MTLILMEKMMATVPTFAVVSARYGLTEEDAQDVTKVVRRFAKPDGLTLKVNNTNMGTDPHPNKRKRLFVAYKLGTDKAKTSSIEGTTLRLGKQSA